MVNKYPCKECVVLPCCSELCVKTNLRNTRLFEIFVEDSCCPDCGNEMFVLFLEYFDRELDNEPMFPVQCKRCRHFFDFDLSEKTVWRRYFGLHFISKSIEDKIGNILQEHYSDFLSEET